MNDGVIPGVYREQSSSSSIMKTITHRHENSQQRQYLQHCYNINNIIVISTTLSQYQQRCQNINNIVTVSTTLSKYQQHCDNINNSVTISRSLSQYQQHCQNISNILTIGYWFNNYVTTIPLPQYYHDKVNVLENKLGLSLGSTKLRQLAWS